MNLRLNLKLDDWQKEVLSYDGNTVIRSGRQVGKSTAVSLKAAKYALENPKKTVMVISSTERQAYLLFEKILNYLMAEYPNYVMKGKYRPTKTKLRLKNGSMIYSLPTGTSGTGIRGFTINLLIADEAAFITRDVWTAITPMMAATGGHLILLSTPHGKRGYFYECFEDESYRKFHISSEDCPRIDKDYLKRERKRMNELEYAQEYLGEFIDELRQLFPTELIEKVCSENKLYVPTGKKYLGIDIARLGTDETVLLSLDYDGEKLRMFGMEILIKARITETIDKIFELDKKHKYVKIYLDDGGVGGGVMD
ncbi:MAG: terminase large subunit domain-containing protein, partial [Elusimicrobiota bacterium]